MMYEMKRKIVFLIIAGILSATGCIAQTGLQKTPAERMKQDRTEKMPTGQAAAFMPGEILVRFNPSAKPEAIEDFCAKSGLSILHRFNSPGLYLLSIQDQKKVPEKIKEVETHPLVAYAEPNYIFSLDNSKKEPTHVPGEALVRFEAKTERSRVELILKELDLQIIEAFALPNLYRVKATAPSTSTEEIVNRLTACPEVLYAEPNFVFTLEPSTR